MVETTAVEWRYGDWDADRSQLWATVRCCPKRAAGTGMIAAQRINHSTQKYTGRLALDESVYDGGRTDESKHAAPCLYVEIIEEFHLLGQANHLPLYRIKSRAGLS